MLSRREWMIQMVFEWRFHLRGVKDGRKKVQTRIDRCAHKLIGPARWRCEGAA
jgi:hypothetical protein